VLVLVTDGEDRAALAACRALARAGHTVAVAAGRRPAPAHSSRACATRLYVPRSLAAEEFVSGLATALLTTTYDALLPASDAALLALSRFRERLPSPLLLGLPPRDAIARSLSKLALLEEAGRVGFAVPESEECVGKSEALAAAAALGYPVVAKPTTSIVTAGDRAQRQGSRVAHDRTKLDHALSALGTPVLIQRFCTAYLPPVWGFLTLTWMRRREYV